MAKRIHTHKLKRELYKDNTTVSKNLRLLRIIYNYKQQDMADFLHMSRSTYFGLESGNKSPDFETLAKLADFYNINLDYLISFDIGQQMIGMMNVDKEETNAIEFMYKFMELSRNGKLQIRDEVLKLSNIEKSFRKFPWRYEGFDKFYLYGALKGKRKMYERGK